MFNRYREIQVESFLRLKNLQKFFAFLKESAESKG